MTTVTSSTTRSYAKGRDVERHGEFQSLLNMLADAQFAVSEAELAERLYGTNTPTHRKKIQRRMQQLREAGGNEYNLHRQTLPNDHRDNNRPVYGWFMQKPVLPTPPRRVFGRHVDAAIGFDLAARYLRDILPPRSYDALRPYFAAAKADLNKVMGRGDKRDYGRLQTRIALTQRGQPLQRETEIDNSILDRLYEAIISNRCIRIEYAASDTRVKTRVLHPAGIVMKPPKVYLYAVPNAEVVELRYQAFLVNRIVSIELANITSRVPLDFDMRRFVRNGHDNLLCLPGDNTIHTITIHVSEVGNLVRDLREFPFYSYTRFVKVEEGNYWILEFRARITEALVEYILARGENFRVVQPAPLVNLLRDRLAGMFVHYHTNT